MGDQIKYCQGRKSFKGNATYGWVSLIASGITKTIELTNGGTFASAMQKMLPYFYSFFIAGIGILAGILLIAIPALVSCIQQIRQNRLVSFQPVT